MLQLRNELLKLFLNMNEHAPMGHLSKNFAFSFAPIQPLFRCCRYVVQKLKLQQEMTLRRSRAQMQHPMMQKFLINFQSAINLEFFDLLSHSSPISFVFEACVGMQVLVETQTAPDMIFSKEMSEMYWRLIPCVSVLFALINTMLTQGSWDVASCQQLRSLILVRYPWRIDSLRYIYMNLIYLKSFILESSILYFLDFCILRFQVTQLSYTQLVHVQLLHTWVLCI